MELVDGVNFPDEFTENVRRLMNFDVKKYGDYIHSLRILSDAQKVWLLNIIPFRRDTILEWVESGESTL